MINQKTFYEFYTQKGRFGMLEASSIQEAISILETHLGEDVLESISRHKFQWKRMSRWKTGEDNESSPLYLGV